MALQLFLLVLINIAILIIVVTSSIHTTQKNQIFNERPPSNIEATKKLIGNGIWAYLNVYSAQFEGNLTVEQQQTATNLIGSILSQYPCTICRLHAIEYVKQHPLDDGSVTTAERLQQWIFDFHRSVNLRLQKSIYTYNQFEAEWIIPYRNCSSCSI